MTFGKNKFTGERKKIKWPGIYNSSGTFIRFTCEEHCLTVYLLDL